MKRIHTLFFTAFCLLSLLFISGCGGDAQKKEQQKACEKNQREILIKLTEYAANNSDKLPADLSVLTKEYALRPECIICPAAKDGNSYKILRKDFAGYNSDIPVICCGAHEGKTVIGYADGHVNTVDGNSAAQAVAK